MSDIESIRAGLARLQAEAARDPRWLSHLDAVEARTLRLKAECIDVKPSVAKSQKTSKVVPIREVEI
jgi:hypothetical protein